MSKSTGVTQQYRINELYLDTNIVRKLTNKWQLFIDTAGQYFWRTYETDAIVHLNNITKYLPWIMEGPRFCMTDDWLDLIHKLLLKKLPFTKKGQHGI